MTQVDARGSSRRADIGHGSTRLDGFPLFSRVRSSPKTSKLPFVLVTALSDAADRCRALDHEADAPVAERRVDQDVLLDAVEELLP
jgi:CheY-like chemotaxis protein